MILSQEQWMNLRAFKAPAEAGPTWAEIARETGYDWRTVKRYPSADAPATSPAPAKRGPGPRLIDSYAHLIDAWLRKPAGRLRVRNGPIPVAVPVGQPAADGAGQDAGVRARERPADGAS